MNGIHNINRKRPHINDADSQCKHLVRAIADQERKGELPRMAARIEAERQEVKRRADEWREKYGEDFHDSF